MTTTPQHQSPHPNSAIEWEALRKRSLVPSGFGSERVDIWPRLLGVSRVYSRNAPSERDTDSEEIHTEKPKPHRDEHQIRLDTDRSFVLYPTSPGRESLQESLHALIVSVFRKRPKLNYFQGYHDIISVLFLTLPPELQFVCAEKLSLHRLRDSMGSTLEPVLGLLRVTKNLLRLADPKYAETLERISPLPFHALSNLLTLFSHDMPTLRLIQHTFDYLLCRPPIAIVYLATAVILSRRTDVERLMHEDDEHEDGMTHSLLNALPEIVDDGPEMEMELKKEDVTEDEGITVAPEDDNTSIKVEFPSPTGVENPEQKTRVKQEHNIPDGKLPTTQEDSAGDQPFTNGGPVECGVSDYSSTFIKVEGKDNRLKEEESATLLSMPEQPKQSADEPPSMPFPTTTTPSHPLSPPRSPATPAEKPLLGASSRRGSSTTITSTPLSLPSLLTQADALYELYPPTHPSLALSSIMGPQSVVYTWDEPKLSSSAGEGINKETEEARLADDEAEAMTACPWLVVYPYIEKDENIHVDEDQTSDEEEEEVGWRWWGEKTTRSDRKGKGKERMKQGNARGGDKKKSRKSRESPLSQLERGTILAGAVVVLGVGIAFYGARVGRGPGVGWDVHEREWREWRWLGGWIGGGLFGAANRMIVR